MTGAFADGRETTRGSTAGRTRSRAPLSGRGPLDALPVRRLAEAVRRLDAPDPLPGPEPRLRALLPGQLTDERAQRDGPAPRSARDWAVDVVLFAASVLGGLAMLGPLAERPGVSPALVTADLVTGLALCAALWWRRRWPVTLALLSLPAGTFSAMSAVASVILLFTVAVHRPMRVALPVAAVFWTPALVYFLVWPEPDPESYVAGVFFVIALTAAVTGWGMFVRARRQLLLSLRERARLAEAEQRRAIAAARQLERTRIAREMHDVLGHRLALLSMHAGALEFRPNAPPEQIAKAAGVVRENVHQALRDLRAVIGVLRDGPEDPTARPQPTLDDLPALVEESRRAGMQIRTYFHLSEAATASPVVAGSAYRIVQEGLTNAHRHAPRSVVRLIVDGAPDSGLHLEMRNRLPSPAGSPGLPSAAESADAAPADGARPPEGRAGEGMPAGAGTGLLGLAERASLVGGRLEHGPTPEGEFRLYAWLPWRSSE